MSEPTVEELARKALSAVEVEASWKIERNTAERAISLAVRAVLKASFEHPDLFSVREECDAVILAAAIKELEGK